jgi:hypothetical protein
VACNMGIGSTPPSSCGAGLRARVRAACSAIQAVSSKAGRDARPTKGEKNWLPTPSEFGARALGKALAIPLSRPTSVSQHMNSESASPPALEHMPEEKVPARRRRYKDAE